jgi:hypothetical protein
MSAFNKLAEFEEEAKKAEAEFNDIYKTADEPAKSEEVKPEEPKVETPPEPAPPVEDWEKKYKDSLKGMNEAQRKAADLEKDSAKKQADLEAKLNEALERARQIQEATKVQPVVEEDDLESDMPEVAKIAKKYASKAQKELEARFDEINKRLKAEEESRTRIENDRTARRMVEDIKAVHPDYDQMVNSDEMIHWINNEAPPMYKAIFEGAIPFHAKDAITVLTAYKSTTTPKPKESAATPSAAEVAAPVKTNTPISTRLKTDAPLTMKDMDWFMHNSHKLKPEELAEWDKRLNG